MRGRGVRALSVRDDRASPCARPEFDHADPGVAARAVASFPIGARARGEVEHDACPAGCARDGQARARVIEFALAARVDALEPVDLAPGYALRPPVAFEPRDHLLECRCPREGRRIGAGPAHPLEPQ